MATKTRNHTKQPQHAKQAEHAKQAKQYPTLRDALIGVFEQALGEDAHERLAASLDELLLDVATRGVNVHDVAGVGRTANNEYAFYVIDFAEFYGSVYPKGLRRIDWEQHVRTMSGFIMYVFSKAKNEGRNYSDCVESYAKIPLGKPGILPFTDDGIPCYGIRIKK